MSGYRARIFEDNGECLVHAVLGPHGHGSIPRTVVLDPTEWRRCTAALLSLCVVAPPPSEGKRR